MGLVFIGALVVAGGAVFAAQKMLTMQPQSDSGEGSLVKEPACDPNDPKVTENVKLKGTYTYDTIEQGSHTFRVISAGLDSDNLWIHEKPWDVCGLPAVLVQTLKDGKDKPAHIIWNGNTYEVPADAEPLPMVHHQLAFKEGYFGKGVVDGKEYDFSDVISKAFSVQGSGAIIEAAPGSFADRSDNATVNVVYKGQTFGPYVDVIPPIVSVNGEPTYFASDGGRKFKLYTSGREVSAPGVSGVPPSEYSLVDYKGQPAYILGSGREYTAYIGTKPQPQFGNALAVYSVGGSLVTTSMVGEEYHLFIDGKDVGVGSSVYDSDGVVGYLSGRSEDGQYSIMRGNKVVGSIDKPSVFYPTRSSYNGSWGDFTFIGDTPAYVYRGGYTGNSYTEQYVGYGNEKLFNGFSVDFVANIGGKLVVKAQMDRTDYVFIEE